MIERYKFDNQGCVGRRVQKDEPDYYECRMTEADDGQYSKHSDCAALEKERDALLARVTWKPLSEFMGYERYVIVRRSGADSQSARCTFMSLYIVNTYPGEAEFLEIPQ